MLRVLDHLFYQRLSKDAILPPADIKNIFTNLEEILQLHGTNACIKSSFSLSDIAYNASQPRQRY